jgi:hypothetical protein
VEICPLRVGLNVLGLIFIVIVKLSVPLNASGRHDDIVELANDKSCTKVNNDSNASLFSDVAADDNCNHKNFINHHTNCSEIYEKNRALISKVEPI